MSGFNITGGKGFQMTFVNGWTVSVQFGAANYCDHYDGRIGSEPGQRAWKSSNAECAAWSSKNEWLPLSEHDDVIGWQSPEEVLALLNRVQSLDRDFTPPKRTPLEIEAE